MNQDNYSFDNSPEDPAGKELENQTVEPAAEPFRRSKLSYLTLFFLLIFWPLMSVSLVGDPAQALRMLSVSPIFMVYLPTMVIQWLVFLLVWAATYRERTGLSGVGFKRIRLIDIAWALAFLLVSNILLTLLSLLLAVMGLEIPGELGLILPKTPIEKILWVFLSLTAGICEETAFRGYLITRIRIFGETKSWIIPVIIASLAFGSGHTYQGAGGFILISTYGAMFAVLFLRTKSLWPCVIAHFLQNFVSGMFYPGPT